MECPDELLNLRSADCALPAFSLQIDHFQAKAVFGDDPVNSFIAGLPDCLTIATGTAVPHLEKQLDDKLLKEPRGCSLDSLKEL